MTVGRYILLASPELRENEDEAHSTQLCSLTNANNHRSEDRRYEEV